MSGSTAEWIESKRHCLFWRDGQKHAYARTHGDGKRWDVFDKQYRKIKEIPATSREEAVEQVTAMIAAGEIDDFAKQTHESYMRTVMASAPARIAAMGGGPISVDDRAGGASPDQTQEISAITLSDGKKMALEDIHFGLLPPRRRRVTLQLAKALATAWMVDNDPDEKELLDLLQESIDRRQSADTAARS